MRKIRRYTEWQSMPYNEKMRYDEGQRISILANQGGIPQMIIDEAMRLHKKISDAKSFRGLNRDGIIAATIYVAARINGYPRSAKEIATIFHLDNTSATRGCRNAISIINELENEMDNNEKTSLGQTTPSSFIERYCSHLNINAELTKLCKFIAQKIQKNNLIPENTPNSIASGILYFVAQKCNLNVSKRSVNNVSDVSEVTINKCFKKLEELQDQLIPKVIIDKYNK
jgi:transcription initiation factor TFIIB